MWFGIGDTMKITIIALAVLIPIYINTHAQLRGVDLQRRTRSDGWAFASGFIRRVALPGAIPGFFTGLRLAVTTSWLALVVVEQINATKGIGYPDGSGPYLRATRHRRRRARRVRRVRTSQRHLVRLIERRALVWRRSLGS